MFLTVPDFTGRPVSTLKSGDCLTDGRRSAVRKSIGVRSVTCFLVVVGLVLAISCSVWAGAQIRTETKAVYYRPGLKVIVNGQEVKFDVESFIVEPGWIMVQLEPVVRKMGWLVKWDDAGSTFDIYTSSYVPVSTERNDLQYLKELEAAMPTLQTANTAVGIDFSVLADDPMMLYNKVMVDAFMQDLDDLWRAAEDVLKIKPTPKYETVHSYEVKSMVEIQAAVEGSRRLLTNKDITAVDDVIGHLNRANLYQKAAGEELVKVRGK
jgi:hypothetical protein